MPPEVEHSANFAVLPDGSFAVLDNLNDRIYFLTEDGAFIDEVAMPEASPGTLQHVDAVTHGNRLIVSETGTGKIFEVDLVTYAVTVLKDFGPGSPWLGGIESFRRTYYVTGTSSIYSFTETGDPLELCSFGSESEVSDMVIRGRNIYVVLNQAGKVYRVDRISGHRMVMASDIDFPRQIAYVPLDLEPTITR
jgi:hypothetical protein